MSIIPNRNVALLHHKMRPEAITLLEALARANQTGLTTRYFQLYEGWRDPRRQDRLFKEGTTKARAWQSAHQYGLAIDIVPTNRDGWTWEIGDDWEWLRDFVERNTSLRRTIAWDKAHFEHPLWQEIKHRLI